MRGSIVRRYKDKKAWSIVLELGYQPDPVTGTLKRKQQWISFRGTKQEAKDELAKLITANNNGEFISPAKTTLVEWLRVWLEKSVKPPMRRPATYALYSVVVEKHLAKATIGAMPIQRVRASDLEVYLAGLTAAPATRAVHYAVLRGALKKAKRDRLIVANPALDVEYHKPEKHSRRTHAKAQAWTATEARRFLATTTAAGTQPAAFYALALDSGARKSELLGLGWQHVNLDAGTVTIERQLTTRKGPPAFGPTKTGLARVVTIDSRTLALLKVHKRAQAELMMRNRTTYREYGLVFAKELEDVQTYTARLGDPLGLRALWRQFAKLTAAAQVRRIRFHGLRHTCATLLLNAGVAVHQVSARLGHATASMTLDVYAHALEDTHATVAATIGAVLYS
jgi:integrase